MSQVSAPYSPKWLQNCWKTSVLWLFVDISLQTRTWSPITQQPDSLCPWNFARLLRNIRQRERWVKFQPHTHKNDCKTAEKHLFCGVCWHFTANQTMIPNNSTTRLSLPMKLCMPFKLYVTKRWAKFQLHTHQNDCKIAEKLLFCGCLLTFHLKQGHDPQ